MRLTLPVPPSVNGFHSVVRGRKITSKEGRKWTAEAMQSIYAQTCERRDGSMFLGPVKITATWFRARRAGDLSNRIKPVEDVLKAAGVYEDDDQIVELHWKRREDKAQPRIEVEVEQIQEGKE